MLGDEEENEKAADEQPNEKEYNAGEPCVWETEDKR